MKPMLIDEIRADHAQILMQMKKLIHRVSIRQVHLDRLFLEIGAHHLAEEDTLYDATKPFAVESVGQAQAFHLVLDDFAQTIQFGDRTHEPLRYQLLLLQHLLDENFRFEEGQLMNVLSTAVSTRRQRALGQRYRFCYQQNLIKLSNREMPAKALTLLQDNH